ncbi:MAG: hypothetical protein ACKPKO_59830, partial [Candidatus Fonsibacter sp.]
MDVFNEVFAKLQCGMRARKIDLGGTRDGLKNVRFCFMEPESEMGRDIMKSAATMVLPRDILHGRLLLVLGTWRSDGVHWESYGHLALQLQRIWKTNRASLQTV